MITSTVLSFYALFLGWVIAFSSPLAGLFLAIIPLVAFIVLSKPSIIYIFSAFFSSLQSIPIFAQNIAGIPGQNYQISWLEAP